MRTAELRELLGRLEESPAPEPSALFVAKLEADLRTMDRTVGTEAPRPRRRRALVAAAPIAALATAAAAAATLLPGDPHPRQVKTTDPGVTVPVPAPQTPPSWEPTPTTAVAAPPWLPPVTAPAPPTTPVAHPAAITRPPRPGQDPAPNLVSPHDPVTTTVPPTTTTAPGVETISLHCGGGVSSGGQPGVSCAWSQSTSASFAWYRLYREVPGTNRVLIFSSDNRSTTSYGDKNVQQGTTYSYRIEVTDTAGAVVGRSASVTVPCC